MKFLFIVGLLLLTVAVYANAPTTVRKSVEFQDVKVLYATTFNITTSSLNGSPSWVEGLKVNSPDEELTVVYALIQIRTKGVYSDEDIYDQDEYVKITGSKGSERFLRYASRYSYGNSKAPTDNYLEPNSPVQQTETFFSAAKVLFGEGTVTKDYDRSAIAHGVILVRSFAPDGSLSGIGVRFSKKDSTLQDQVGEDDLVPASPYEGFALAVNSAAGRVEYGNATVVGT